MDRMRLTRREALAGAGAALIALRAGAARAMPPEPPLPAAMGRGIDLTPQGDPRARLAAGLHGAARPAVGARR